jgi:hypothetical protein
VWSGTNRTSGTNDKIVSGPTSISSLTKVCHLEHHLSLRPPSSDQQVGYPLTRCTIRPFSDTDLTNDAAESQRRKLFNKKLSSLRQAVKHAFGRLKGQFPILRDFKGYRMDIIYKTVEALLVLYNILASRGDDPDSIEGFNGEEDPDVAEVAAVHAFRPREAHAADEFSVGIVRRKLLLDQLAPP